MICKARWLQATDQKVSLRTATKDGNKLEPKLRKQDGRNSPVVISCLAVNQAARPSGLHQKQNPSNLYPYANLSSPVAQLYGIWHILTTQVFTHPLRQVLCSRKAPHLSWLEMNFSQLDIPEFYVLAIVKIQQVTMVQITITETFILPVASVTVCIPQSVRKQPFLPERQNLHQVPLFLLWRTFCKKHAALLQ